MTYKLIYDLMYTYHVEKYCKQIICDDFSGFFVSWRPLREGDGRQGICSDQRFGPLWGGGVNNDINLKLHTRNF